MENKEIFEMLAEILDVEVNRISSQSILDEYEDWDSLAKLSLMAQVKQRKNHQLKQEELKRFVTVEDICEYLRSI